MVFEDGIAVTYRQFLDRVERFAGYLQQRLQPSDRVAIMVENRAEFMIAWIAVVANRAALVCINTAAQEFDAGYILRDSAPVMTIVDESHKDLILSLVDGCPSIRETVVVSGQEPDGLAAYGHADESLPLAAVSCEPEDVTNVYYTSGTTGAPKGCMLTHEFNLRFVDLYVRMYGMTASDRMLCCLQFFYNDPSWMLLLSFHADTTLVVMRRFSVSRFWDVVRTHGATRLFSLASIPSLMLKAPASADDHNHSMTHALNAGIPKGLHAELNARWGFPWDEIYGLTETGFLTLMPTAVGADMVGSGSIGMAVPEAALRIVGDEDEDVASGAMGEILAQAPGIMIGYLNRPDATAETMRNDWFHTGDLGMVDEQGFVYFLGRKKDIIRRSGENVAAGEVEQVLRMHPKVLEAAVIPVPDDLRGEELKAYVQLIPAESPDSVSPREIVEHCGANLAKYKVPRFIEYRFEDFPRTPSLRVRKEALKQERADLRAGAWDREQELGW
jgi:crotonobetaine/carnitine-CoA ligase